MSKNESALEAKFEIAVKTLLKAPNLTVPEAMLVAKFSTKDIENKSMQKIILRRFPGGKRAMATLLPPALLPPSIVDVPTYHSPQILHLTTLSGGDGDTAIAGRIQPPKRKQQRMTASALQQKQVEDLKQKRHQVDVHKDAVRLSRMKRRNLKGPKCCLGKCRITFKKSMVSGQVFRQYNNT
jgi:hypothetical protein